MQQVLERIFNQFQVRSNYVSFKELNSGHINDTFLITTDKAPFYVLQKINATVFTEPIQLIKNKVAVSNHLQRKYKELSIADLQRSVLCFVQANDATYYYNDADGSYWCMSIFVDEAITYEKATSQQIAFEAGKAIGNFLLLTSDFNTDSLHEILPNFHHVGTRFSQFEKALANASAKRKEAAKELIRFVNTHIEEMFAIDKAIENGSLTTRLTHSDTKISNILFSDKDEALCLIDTDTVMSGVIHYDYGDAIRTICNTNAEDSIDMQLIEFSMEYFKAYTEGFVSELKGVLTVNEIQLLPISVKIMPFLIGMRFLTDFLQDDIYFKTTYSQHNFDRATNQFKLVKEIINKYATIQEIIASSFIDQLG